MEGKVDKKSFVLIQMQKKDCFGADEGNDDEGNILLLSSRLYKNGVFG